MKSELMKRVNLKKIDAGDHLADTIVDLCFVTSYKIEELLTMPPLRLQMLIDRFQFHFSKKEIKK